MKCQDQYRVERQKASCKADSKAVALSGPEQPVSPTGAVIFVSEQKLAVVAAVGQVPDAAWYVCSFCSWHGDLRKDSILRWKSLA
jgi:hypothetical protein